MIIGIDPDAKKSGWCVLNKNGEIVELESLDFFEIVDRLRRFEFNYSGCEFAIEDVTKNKAVYNRKAGNLAMLKIAQNVGQVKQACMMIIDAIKYYTGKECLLVPPGVGKQVKKNPKLFKKITNYNLRTNEDKRDAWAVAKYAKNKNYLFDK